MNRNDRHRYDDILDLPHPISKTHPQMPVADRAAQFAPFAALTGHGEAVRETARPTEKRIELDEDSKAVLDAKLQSIRKQLESEPLVTITYFVPDKKKQGGMYVTVTGSAKKIQEYERSLILTDGTRIPVDEIVEIELLTHDC